MLGAGFSRRFGTDKRLAILSDRTVAETTVQAYANVFDDLRVVLRREDEALADLLSPFAELIISEDAHLGMGHSLAAGFIDLEWEWAFVGLLDMPFIMPTTLTQLQQFARTTDQRILRPRLITGSPTENTPPHGHPLGFHHSLFAELRKITGDEGARSVLQAHANWIEDVALTDTGIVRDIDHPKDVSLALLLTAESTRPI